MPWEPDARLRGRELETPFEDVPEHLVNPLWEWCAGQINSTGVLTEIGVEFRLPLPEFNYNTLWDVRDELEVVAKQRPAFQLDLIHYLLREVAPFSDNPIRTVKRLEKLLSSGNSAYAVRADGLGLEQRITAAVKDQVQAVVDAAEGSPGEHLTNAWNEAYGKNADPVKSYSESIKAVEAAMAERISPQNAKQTLGTMVRDVRAKPEKWISVLPDGGVGTVLSMMQTLWDGQTSRHGGLHPTRHETVEEAQAAVHLAATLVQFGVTGGIDLAAGTAP